MSYRDSIDAIRSIPGNQPVIEALRGYLAERNAIAFVGAGASANLYPLWKDLIEQLSESAVKAGLAKEEEKRFWIETSVSRPAQVVQSIKETMGSKNYSNLMQEIFGYRLGPDGKPYTPIQSAIVRMNFRGIVTTNFDAGLLESRQIERPTCTATGYATGSDRDALQLWLSGDIFRDEQFPVLFAHGIFQRTETIVLGAGEYRSAYRPGLYRHVFEKLWSQERLVIIGFSFNDDWLTFVCEEVLAKSQAFSAGPTRHIAILGLRENEPYSPQMRRLFQNSYNAEVIFYQITRTNEGKEDHSALLDLLESLVSKQGTQPEASIDSQIHKQAHLRALWVHETTNDARYIGRNSDILRLDRLLSDPQVKMIAITGLGGQGKTALVGQWLKVHGADMLRSFDGLFYWSFYADRAMTSFVNTLLKFTGTTTREPVLDPRKSKRLVDYAIEAIKAKPYLIVLDGLEVLQERPGSESYGALLEDDLRDFLDAASWNDHKGVVVLTSRFPFADLTAYLGTTVRLLQLDRLSPLDGAALLERSGVQGTQSAREVISKRLEGHPLALRVFAAALSTQTHGDPTRLWSIVFTDKGLSEDEPLMKKLQHLLVFYDSQLPPEGRVVLGVVSLFQAPIDEPSVILLTLKQIRRTIASATVDDRSVTKVLETLVGSGLLLREYVAQHFHYSCHPVLRDHFRLSMIRENGEMVGDAAIFLTERPADKRPTDIKQLMPVLNAIDLLLEANRFESAHLLYQGRLMDGELFLGLPAVHEGRRCALAFVADSSRRNECEARLTRRSLIWYLNATGFFSGSAGEPDDAVNFYKISAETSRAASDAPNLSITLCNLAEMYIQLGRLNKAVETAREAIIFAGRSFNSLVLAACYTELGHALGLQGLVSEALETLASARDIQAPGNSDARIRSLWEIKQADILLRLGDSRRAMDLASRNLHLSECRQWFNDTAKCNWILARWHLRNGSPMVAEKKLAEAELILRRGHMLSELAWILLSQADIRMRSKALTEASHLVEQALHIASPRNLRLCHIEALIMRGHLALRSFMDSNRGTPQKSGILDYALDDGETALHIASSCGYAWGQQEASSLLSDIWSEMGEQDIADRYRQSVAGYIRT